MHLKAPAIKEYRKSKIFATEKNTFDVLYKDNKTKLRLKIINNHGSKTKMNLVHNKNI